MNLTVHSSTTHNPEYWVTNGNTTIFLSEDGATALQWAIDNGNNIIQVDGTITLNRPFNFQDITLQDIQEGIRLIHTNQWHRICSRCNGPIYKGEGQIIGKCKTDDTRFWQHKKYGLCQKFMYGE